MRKVLPLALLATLPCIAQPPAKKGPNTALVAVSLTSALLVGTWLMTGPHLHHSPPKGAATLEQDELIKSYAAVHGLGISDKDLVCFGDEPVKAQIQIARRELQSCVAGEMRALKLNVANGQVTVAGR